MSGHSKWTQIKRQKAVADKKKGAIFTKLGYAISIAARHGGADPDMNFKLRMAIDKAKAANMPNENIERAINKGAGGAEGAELEEVTYEGFGPGGIAIIIEALTDNKNRITSTIRNAFNKHEGSLGSNSSVNYLFNQKGVIRILKTGVNNKDEFELNLIDAGADDILEEEEGFTIYTKPDKLTITKATVEKMGITAESADLEMVPTNKVSITDQHIEDQLTKLLEELEINDDIINVYTNADA
jgi:YebC/PmpR family DNA-binding regulatory protein